MATLEQINDKINQLGSDINFLVKPDIKALPDILNQNEELIDILQGMYNDRNGLLVLTNIRVLYFSKKLIGGMTVEDFPISKISSIQYNTGFMSAQIKIFASGNTAEFKMYTKKRVKEFVDNVNSKLNPTDASKTNDSEQKDDFASKLEKLAKLKEQGILTENEFNEQKTKLLANI